MHTNNWWLSLTLSGLESGGSVRVLHRSAHTGSSGGSRIDRRGSHGRCHQRHLSGCLGSGSSLLLCEEDGGIDLFLWLEDRNDIVERDLGTDLSVGVVREHDLDSDTNDTLTHQDVTNSNIRVDLSGVSGLDHVSVSELHGLCTLSAKLSGNDDLTSLGGRLHHETDHTVASTTNGKTSEQLELERFGLGLSAKSTVVHTFGVQFHSTIGKLETLLDDRGQLTDALSFLSEDVLCACGADDDLGPVGRGADLHSGKAIFGELTGQQLVQLGVEHSIGNELALGTKAAAAGGGHGRIGNKRKNG